MLDRLHALLRRLEPGDWAGFLVGSGAGLLGFGVLEHFVRLYDPTPTTWRIVLGAVLIALGVGLAIPHRVATWAAGRLWQHARGLTAHQVPDDTLAFPPKDRPLHRVVLAALSLACGGGAIASLGLIRVVRGMHAALLGEFLWGPTSLLVMESVLVVVVAATVFVPVGLVWSCAHHLSCPVGGWRIRPLAGVSAGMAVAAALVMSVRGAGLGASPALPMLLGSIPFFALSILSVRFASTARNPDVPGIADRAAAEIGANRPTLLQMVVLTSFACAVLSAGIWWRVFGLLSGGGGAAMLTVWFLGFAVGAATAASTAHRRGCGVGMLGSLCAIAGVTTALCAGLVGVLGIRAHQLAGMAGGVHLLAGLTVLPSSLALGHAVTHGGHTVLSRATRRSNVGVNLLSRMMFVSAASLAVALTPLVLAVGTYAGLVAVSLVLVGVGGVLVIHEPTPLRRTRRVRLAMVFGSVTFMSLALPHASGDWLTTHPWARLRFEERAWLTRSIWADRGELRIVSEPAPRHSDSASCSITPKAGDGVVPVRWCAEAGSLRVALVGSGVAQLACGLLGPGVALDHLVFDPSGGPPAHTIADRGLGEAHRPSEPALRFLRRTRHRYDIVVIGADELPAGAWGSSRWADLAQLVLDRLRVDGIALLAIPAAQAPRAVLLEHLEALRRVGCSSFAWQSTSRGPNVTLWLAFGSTPEWRTRWRGPSLQMNTDPAPLLAALAYPNAMYAPSEAQPSPIAVP